MKIILACREGSGAYYIANLLAEEGLIQAIILESGAKARRAKLRRILRKSNVFKLPLVFLDLVSNMFYSRFCEKYLQQKLLKPRGWTVLPDNVLRFDVDDINEKSCLEFLRVQSPDVLVVLGTAILKKEVLSIPPKLILNIHGGIVPEYRNVHCDFWALRLKDYSHIGTSIIYLDEGIDSGDIALQNTIESSEGDGILSVKRKNLELAGDLILEAIHRVSKDELPRIPQKEAAVGIYPTPRFIDIFALLTQIAKNKLRIAFSKKNT